MVVRETIFIYTFFPQKCQIKDSIITIYFQEMSSYIDFRGKWWIGLIWKKSMKRTKDFCSWQMLPGELTTSVRKQKYLGYQLLYSKMFEHRGRRYCRGRAISSCLEVSRRVSLVLCPEWFWPSQWKGIQWWSIYCFSVGSSTVWHEL